MPIAASEDTGRTLTEATAMLRKQEQVGFTGNHSCAKGAELESQTRSFWLHYIYPDIKAMGGGGIVIREREERTSLDQLG